MIKTVVLCGEGLTDYGQQEYGTDNWIEGPLHPLIRKCSATEFNILCIDKREVTKIRLQRTKAKGHGVKAHKLIVCAKNKGIQYAICYVDADRESGSKNNILTNTKRFNEVYNEIKEGFKQIDVGVLGIPMVPLKMIESWLLSDRIAFEKVFEKKLNYDCLPIQPEHIWGDCSDPSSEYPKNYLDRVIKEYNDSNKKVEIHKQIAENINIETLREKCPISFGKFVEDFRLIME